MTNHKEKPSGAGVEIKKPTQKRQRQRIVDMDLSKAGPVKPPPSIEVMEDLLRIVQHARRNKIPRKRPRF